MSRQIKTFGPTKIILPQAALRQVTSRTGKGVYASSDKLFKGAVFGRDSIEVAEDIMTTKPRLVEEIILTLASLQGENYNDTSEEEPGRILHEHRTSLVDGKPLDDVSERIFNELSRRWGGNSKEITYYGSIDATPHFLRMVGRYSRLVNPGTLHKKVRLRSGKTVAISEVFSSSLKWLTAKLRSSKSGLLEYQRRNNQGIENQAWKDSREFYVHENGTQANHDAPIGSIEVQGLAYDAIMEAAKMLPEQSDELIEQAENLRDAAVRLLWDDKRRYFGLGVDYDETGEIRVIRTPTANPAALLDTMIFDSMAPADRYRYISGIVRTVMGPDFLTDAGIRSRSLRFAHLVPYWDYHGSYVTWPKETYDIAKGLRRQCLEKLARQLENRLLNLYFRTGSYQEFAYVDEHGRVMTGSPTIHEKGNLMIIDSTNKPESVQAWTVSAIYAILSGRVSARIKPRKAVSRPENIVRLENEIMTRIPRVDRMINPWALSARYPSYPYKVVKSKSAYSTDMPER